MINIFVYSPCLNKPYLTTNATEYESFPESSAGCIFLRKIVKYRYWGTDYMKLKKFNAILSLVTFLGLIAHLTHQIVTYVFFLYQPVLSKIFGFTLVGLFVLHGGLAVTMLFVSHDSQKIEYKKLNKRTLFQRITAGLIMILLPVHIFSFQLMKNSYGTIWYVLLEITKYLYYGSVLVHFALSFGNALVTLGLLENRKKKKILDLILLIVAIVFAVGFGIYITVCQQFIFSM